MWQRRSGAGYQIVARPAWLGHQRLQASDRQHQQPSARCRLSVADEAFYAGDKQHVGVLKALITEPHLTIEAKC
jgi:hypothetical protein